MKLKITTILLASFIASGCQTMASKQALLQEEAQTKATDEYKAMSNSIKKQCFEAWEADSRIDPIKAKIPQHIPDATFEQLNDTSKPNAIQKKAIAAYDELTDKCDTAMASLNFPIHPNRANPVISDYYYEKRKLRGTLFRGEVTFGQFLTLNKDLEIDFKNKFRAAMHAGIEQDARHAAELRAIRRRNAEFHMNNADNFPSHAKIFKPDNTPQQRIECRQTISGRTECVSR